MTSSTDYPVWLSVLLIVHLTSGQSVNQPKFSPCASWNPNATTFANSSTVGNQSYGIFVSINNTVYVADKSDNRVQVWLGGSSSTPTRTISGGLNSPWSLFVTINGDVYVDNGNNGQVDRWKFNATSSAAVMNVSASCYGLFVDINNTLYCSMANMHQIVKGSLNNSSSSVSIAAGTGSIGNAPNMLYWPSGIFVDINFNLYVADSGNSRIQLFEPGQLNGTTVAGSTAAVSFALYSPTDVVLDGDGYLFIVDQNNNRIVRSGPNGFQCVAGCSAGGSASNQLNRPQTVSFDSYGNMLVTDYINSRVQKFILATNSCGECW